MTPDTLLFCLLVLAGLRWLGDGTERGTQGAMLPEVTETS